jgi:ATP-binding cassette subfamily F protein 3
MDLEVRRLSGGQKARLLMLLVVIEKPDLLILDEPTNHLDIESREALIMALNDYKGSLILVSHDAFLVERLVDRLLIIKDGNVSEFSGDIHDYRKLILSNNSKKKKQESVLKNKKSNVSIPNFSLSDLKKSLTYSEKKILEFEKQKKTLEIEMLNQNFYSSNNQKRAQEVNVNLQKVLIKIAEEEKVWEKIVESIELISK